jgi:hypothetical protein
VLGGALAAKGNLDQAIKLTREALAALGDTPLRVQSHGHWRMKGLEEPFELLELGGPDRMFTAPHDGDKVYRVVAVNDLWIPLATLKHTLPGERDTFVGRVSRIGSATTARFALLPTPNPSGNFTKITQRVPVKIDIVDPPKPLTPGMMVEVEIDVR